ncbi:hypothetical protein ES703_82429 [subsurface metagenome]
MSSGNGSLKSSLIHNPYFIEKEYKRIDWSLKDAEVNYLAVKISAERR